MNTMLPRPRFWAEAAEQNKTRFSMLGEFLMLLFLYYISVLAQSLLLAIPMTPWALHEKGDALAAALNAGESLESVMNEVMGAIPDWLRLFGLFAYGAMGALAILYCRRFQKRTLASMGLRGSFWKEYACGLLAGLLLFGAVLALGVCFDAYRPVAAGDMPARLPLVLAALLGCAVQGASMELLLRGYFAPSLGTRYPLPLALAMSTAASAILNGDITSLYTVNSLLLALVLGVFVLKRGNLWCACALHGVWLFAQSFLCCFAPAGEAYTGIYLFAVQTDGYRKLLTGGALGPQGSLCTTLVLLAALALVVSLRAKDPAPSQPPQHEQAANNL